MLRLINGITSLLQAVFMGPESVLQGRLLHCAGVFAPERLCWRWEVGCVVFGTWHLLKMAGAM